MARLRPRPPTGKCECLSVCLSLFSMKNDKKYQDPPYTHIECALSLYLTISLSLWRCRQCDFDVSFSLASSCFFSPADLQISFISNARMNAAHLLARKTTAVRNVGAFAMAIAVWQTVEIETTQRHAHNAHLRFTELLYIEEGHLGTAILSSQSL